MIRSNLIFPAQPQGLSSTSEFQFNGGTLKTDEPFNPDGDLWGNLNSTPAVISFPASILRNRRIRVRAEGRVNTGTTTNFTVKLYYGAALDSLVFSSGALAVNSKEGSWELEVELTLEPHASKILGIGKGQLAGAVVAQAATTAVTGVVTVPDALNPSATDAKEKLISFSVSGQFSVSNSSNEAQLHEFTVEEL